MSLISRISQKILWRDQLDSDLTSSAPFQKMSGLCSQKTTPNWLYCQFIRMDICFTRNLAWMFTASRWKIVLVQFGLLNLALYMAMLGALTNQLKSDAFFGVQLLKSCFSFLAFGIGSMSGVAIIFLFVGLILPDSKKRAAARDSMINIDKTRDQLINRIRNQDA